MGKNVNGVFSVVLTSQDYIIGVKVLAWSLQCVVSRYNLLLLYTPETISSQLVQELTELHTNIRLKPINLLKTPLKNIQHARPYYSETWTKFEVFNLTEYTRVVLLDADMLIRKNIDSLMDLELPTGWIAAVSACVCNPLNQTSYPRDWIPENCPYNHNNNVPNSNDQAFGGYFNSGLIVLNPSSQSNNEIMAKFHNTTNWSKYQFPDQDFLNEVYAKKWICLPYFYNGLRPLSLSHPEMWKYDEIHVVHYIFLKPWQDKEWIKMDNEERRAKDQFYTVNSWWWNAYNQMISGIGA